MKVSMIIPVYNAEKYLSRCLDSILVVKSVDWECILIDDGSTDKSWDIICEYTGKSDRFIARRKENEGVSSARNLGLKICTGDRIMFVDADDYIFPEADQLLYKAVTDYANYDMILFSYAYILPNGTKKKIRIPPSDFKDEREWIKKYVFQSSIMDCSFSKMFKHSIIEEHNIWFNTNMRIAEDSFFVSEYLQYLHTAVVENDGILYAYRSNNTSAMHSFYKKDILDCLRGYKKKLELVEKRNISISKADKGEMDSSFIDGAIYGYSYRCAAYCSYKEFKRIMQTTLDGVEIFKIFHNRHAKSNGLKKKMTKFLLQNRIYRVYFYLVRIIRSLSYTRLRF